MSLGRYLPHILYHICSTWSTEQERRMPLLWHTKFTEYGRVWHSYFVSCEAVLSLSNVFVQSKSYKQNIKGWCYLLLTETGFFEHPMLKWLFNTVIHRSFLVQSKCSNETACILLGNTDTSFIGWTLVNTWQQMVLYPKRHVSCMHSIV